MLPEKTDTWIKLQQFPKYSEHTQTQHMYEYIERDRKLPKFVALEFFVSKQL
jgi:hypothetical protein